MLRPVRIQMDASSHCQLACPCCPTASGDVSRNIGAGHLRVEDLRGLLQQNPFLTDIELANYGEMFLNPHLTDILKYCCQQGIVVHADTGVNLNFAPSTVLEALVKYRVRSMTCSIDGATQATYQRYRRGGTFERVIAHINEINRYKRVYCTGFPQLTWQFIVFGHNEHEIELAKAKAAELGMRFYTKLSWDDHFSPIRKPELVRIVTDAKYVSRPEYERGTGVNYCRRLCYQMWSAPVANFDGTMLGCCRNFWKTYDTNVFRDGLLPSVNSEMMTYARSMLMGAADARPDIPCTTCDVYESLKSSGRWLTEEEIRSADRRSSGILLSVVVISTADGLESARVIVSEEGRPNTTLTRTLISKQELAVFFRLPRQGRYCVSVLPFTIGGATIGKRVFNITVSDRPICQEIKATVDPSWIAPQLCPIELCGSPLPE